MKHTFYWRIQRFRKSDAFQYNYIKRSQRTEAKEAVVTHSKSRVAISQWICLSRHLPYCIVVSAAEGLTVWKIRSTDRECRFWVPNNSVAGSHRELAWCTDCLHRLWRLDGYTETSAVYCFWLIVELIWYSRYVVRDVGGNLVLLQHIALFAGLLARRHVLLKVLRSTITVQALLVLLS
jgi:hypothetical protein